MDISALKIAPAKAGQLRNKGIGTVEQLLTTYPIRYQDYRKRTPLTELSNHIGQSITVVGEVCNLRGNYQKGMVLCSLTDHKGNFVNIAWFNQIFIMKQLWNGCNILVHGKLTYNDTYKNYNIAGPTYFSLNIGTGDDLIPVYPSIKGMSSNYYNDCLIKAQNLYAFTPSILRNPINTATEENLKLLPQRDFIRIVHHPQTDEDLKAIERRKAAEVLIPFAKELTNRESVIAAPRYTEINLTKTNNLIHSVTASLPFELTEDQKSAVNALLSDVKAGKRINALIQGDVGCGKTVIAELISAIFAVNGYQCVVMAPTKILTTQHYEDFKKLLTPVGIEVELLVEGQKAAERKKTIARIKDGSVKIIIGTSSVLSEKVEYKDLALLITDEEHRFGVAQREALMEKAKDGIHCISMSATPIPRSLALAINGNSMRIIDVKTMPSGRKPVQTILFGNEEKTYEAMYRQIAEGHQCYIVCPLVDKSDSESMENVESVDETYQKATDYFQMHHPSVKIVAITGKTKKAEQQGILNAYVAGDIHILIATTIVEVGVNVPNATVMVIKNAERFGLAQLHQLRGRVGRSSTQSYCVLLSKDKENPRLLTMVRTTDGFEIAKADLEQRGAGDLIGVEQSGFNKVLTCMAQHKELYNAILSEIGKTI